MFVHEASPSHGRLTVTACDHLNVNTPHIGETTRDTGNFGRASLPTFQWTLNPAAPFGMRKIDETFAVQNGQGLAAGRFLVPAAERNPPVPFADLTSQRPSRNRGRLVNCPANSMDRSMIEFKATYSHHLNIATEKRRGQVCPQQLMHFFHPPPDSPTMGAGVGNCQFRKGGPGGILQGSAGNPPNPPLKTDNYPHMPP